MAVLPDFDALALKTVVMFEKGDSLTASLRALPMRRAEDGSRLDHGGIGVASGRFESRSARRGGDALRAVEWSEITARLNAARDLRLLLRSESQGRIEAVAASFGDAAASYFAMIEDNELAVNHDALDGSKALGGTECACVAVRHDAVSGGDAERAVDAPGGVARVEQ
ncbi:hypothetical protein [Erythrobacter tepidarius]|uniref:hypothetical protein n=1 Tax=Erythrobacter tepidarius TaxID=60454 RepID=UPI001180DEAE|nr:hypothetical protein [Erythrobacter tepidarius]